MRTWRTSAIDVSSQVLVDAVTGLLNRMALLPDQKKRQFRGVARRLSAPVIVSL
jgi:hypothetical protein